MKKRVLIGVGISVVALYLALRNVDLGAMFRAMGQADYVWLLPAVAAMLISVLVRAVRWRYFFHDSKSIGVHRLFAVTMIGYMANNVLPLRVGELVRAYALGSTERVPFATAFSTVVVERILDLLTMVVLLGLTLLFYPFPDWVRSVGLVTFAGISVAVGWCFLISKENGRAAGFFERLVVFLPERLQQPVLATFRRFVQGLLIFRRSEHYGVVTLLTVVMWLLYAGIIYFSLIAFDFIGTYDMPPVASFAILVMVSIGIAIPSSPGFVGTYDLLAQQSLTLFGVPASQALGCALVMHLVNYVPLTSIGLVYAFKLNIDYARMARDAAELQEGQSHTAGTSVTAAAGTDD